MDRATTKEAPLYKDRPRGRGARRTREKEAKKTEPDPKKRKRTSEAWSHFETSRDGVACVHCGRLYAKSTSTGTLMTHFEKEHSGRGGGGEVKAKGGAKKRRVADDFDSVKADAMIKRFIVSEGLPSWMVEDEDFVALLAYLRPDYKPPRKRDLARKRPKAAHA